MEELKELLAKECNGRFSMDSPVMEHFISLLTEGHLKHGEVLTRYGQLDTNIYIIRRGILKLCYFDGDSERIFAFGVPGTLSTQMHCYYTRTPSIFQYEACTDAVMMKISKQEFDALIRESADFSRWVLDRALDQLCSLEIRLDRINGQAENRYLNLLQIAPEVVSRVRAKDIASYLGITPDYFSKLKKRLAIRKASEKVEEPSTRNAVRLIKRH